jgi:FtsH-binding integral membrane protein
MNLMNFPTLVFVLSFAFLYIAAWFGGRSKRQHPLPDEERSDFDLVLSATLTLLGLLIGFTFSMAISRYDQRKLYEEAEANAIGTEFVRADLLPAADGAKLQDLLKKYLDQRVLFYTTGNPGKLAKVNADTAELQNELWSAVRSDAVAQPTPITALVISGMNDVLNSRGYTQSAWWNRIPIAAWVLMAAIAVGANLLIGYSTRWTDWRLLMIVPLAVSLSFFLISDIDSPRGGAIRVVPRNLLSLSHSLSAQ